MDIKTVELQFAVENWNQVRLCWNCYTVVTDALVHLLCCCNLFYTIILIFGSRNGLIILTVHIKNEINIANNLEIKNPFDFTSAES